MGSTDVRNVINFITEDEEQRTRISEARDNLFSAKEQAFMPSSFSSNYNGGIDSSVSQQRSFSMELDDEYRNPQTLRMQPQRFFSQDSEEDFSRQSSSHYSMSSQNDSDSLSLSEINPTLSSPSPLQKEEQQDWANAILLDAARKLLTGKDEDLVYTSTTKLLQSFIGKDLNKDIVEQSINAYKESLEKAIETTSKSEEKAPPFVSGIGIELGYDEEKGAVVVLSSCKGASHGLKEGDVITKVGDEDITNLEQAAKLIRGDIKEAVTITVEREGEGERTVECTRQIFDTNQKSVVDFNSLVISATQQLHDRIENLDERLHDSETRMDNQMRKMTDTIDLMAKKLETLTHQLGKQGEQIELLKKANLEVTSKANQFETQLHKTGQHLDRALQTIDLLTSKEYGTQFGQQIIDTILPQLPSKKALNTVEQRLTLTEKHFGERFNKLGMDTERAFQQQSGRIDDHETRLRKAETTLAQQEEDIGKKALTQDLRSLRSTVDILASNTVTRDEFNTALSEKATRTELDQFVTQDELTLAKSSLGNRIDEKASQLDISTRSYVEQTIEALSKKHEHLDERVGQIKLSQDDLLNRFNTEQKERKEQFGILQEGISRAERRAGDLEIRVTPAFERIGPLESRTTTLEEGHRKLSRDIELVGEDQVKLRDEVSGRDKKTKARLDELSRSLDDRSTIVVSQVDDKLAKHKKGIDKRLGKVEQQFKEVETAVKEQGTFSRLLNEAIGEVRQETVTLHQTTQLELRDMRLDVDSRATKEEVGELRQAHNTLESRVERLEEQQKKLNTEVIRLTRAVFSPQEGEENNITRLAKRLTDAEHNFSSIENGLGRKIEGEVGKQLGLVRVALEDRINAKLEELDGYSGTLQQHIAKFIEVDESIKALQNGRTQDQSRLEALETARDNFTVKLQEQAAKFSEELKREITQGNNTITESQQRQFLEINNGLQVLQETQQQQGNSIAGITGRTSALENALEITHGDGGAFTAIGIANQQGNRPTIPAQMRDLTAMVTYLDQEMDRVSEWSKSVIADVHTTTSKEKTWLFNHSRVTDAKTEAEKSQGIERGLKPNGNGGRF